MGNTYIPGRGIQGVLSRGEQQAFVQADNERLAQQFPAWLAMQAANNWGELPPPNPNAGPPIGAMPGETMRSSAMPNELQHFVQGELAELPGIPEHWPQIQMRPRPRPQSLEDTLAPWQQSIRQPFRQSMHPAMQSNMMPRQPQQYSLEELLMSQGQGGRMMPRGQLKPAGGW